MANPEESIEEPARKKTAATKIVSVEEEEESDDLSDASIGIIHAGNTCKSGLKQHSKRTGKNVDVNLSQDSDDNNKQSLQTRLDLFHQSLL
ncbi:hypothetical protein PtA15_8A13 [Puccinia triticina]|uniref:Uncharacterized protein n=1 Tax=Puccinia triticina TaxID=208348 RepID=A0ABY7CRL4_9BASI|nr:uncharacterized protein PtA15_8A13 [Puccinia triticina]WAQ87112.1 hypothetical protein PtA15_8A13 [Puccinia triticina]